MSNYDRVENLAVSVKADFVLELLPQLTWAYFGVIPENLQGQCALAVAVEDKLKEALELLAKKEVEEHV